MAPLIFRKSFWTHKRIAQVVHALVLGLYMVYTLGALGVQALGGMDTMNALSVMHTYGLIVFCFSHAVGAVGVGLALAFFGITSLGAAVLEWLIVQGGQTYTARFNSSIVLDVPTDVVFSWYFQLYLAHHLAQMATHALYKPDADKHQYNFGHRRDNASKAWEQIAVESVVGGAFLVCWDLEIEMIGSGVGALWTYSTEPTNALGYSNIPFWHYVYIFVGASVILALYQLFERFAIIPKPVVTPYTWTLALSPVLVLFTVMLIYASVATPVVVRTTAFVALGTPILLGLVNAKSYVAERRRIAALNETDNEYMPVNADDL